MTYQTPKVYHGNLLLEERLRQCVAAASVYTQEFKPGKKQTCVGDACLHVKENIFWMVLSAGNNLVRSLFLAILHILIILAYIRFCAGILLEFWYLCVVFRTSKIYNLWGSGFANNSKFYTILNDYKILCISNSKHLCVSVTGISTLWTNISLQFSNITQW